MSNDETDRVAADALAVLIESWNRSASGDPGGPPLYGTGYWPDAELVDPSGSIWDGQPAIVQMHVDLWRTAFKGSTLNGSVRRTRRLGPSLMIADFDLELRLFGAAPPGGTATDGTLTTHLKHVMEKRGEAWKVVAAQNTFYTRAPRGSGTASHEPPGP